MNEVSEESKMYQLNGMRVLNDIQRSYEMCWTAQITKRCAQILLKYESIAVIRLYETGMLDESEYSHICELIKDKIYDLEYGTIQLPADRKKSIEGPFDLLALFKTLPEGEKIYWKSVMKPKHRWLQPHTILLEKYQPVSVAYLIVRGIIESKDENVRTYYTSGNILGIDKLFSQTESSESQSTYSASSGLVEVFVIDSDLLDTLLADEKISREIYIEMALQMLINNYQPQLKEKHLQFKLLLNERAILSRNKSDLIIDLKANDRLFLLAGTLTPSLNQKDHHLKSPFFISLDSSVTYRLNSFTIVLTWTEEDEIHYLNVEKCTNTFPLEQSQSTLIDALHPRYSNETIEFTPRRQSVHLTPPVRHFSHLQFIPFDLDVKNELTSPLEVPEI